MRHKDSVTYSYPFQVLMSGKKPWLFAIVILSFLGSVSCTNNEEVNSKSSDNALFKMGERLPSDIITGTAWHNLLMEADTTYNIVMGSEEFTPGSRNVWHSHPGGQIIIVTDGVGYHQIKGQPIQVVRKGDIIRCPPNVLHWHGASKDSSVTQIYIVPHSEKGIVKWYGKVSDEEYNNVPSHQ